ncbi:M48 family metalloprotease [Halovulum marinum]|nr:M48 family metalloprotease [Halovulum marinum]
MFRPVPILALLSFALLSFALLTFTGPAAGFTSAERDAGARAHEGVVIRHGGAYYFPALSEYVNQVGARLADQTEEPPEAWTFTILDTATATAFARPGGYVYVSRGLLALANSEAELAAALAQPMAHLLTGALRPAAAGPMRPDTVLAPDALLDGLTGIADEGVAPAPPPRRDAGTPPPPDTEAEVAAAKRGVAMLAAAGYPTRAAAELAVRLQTHDALARRLDQTSRVAMLGATPEQRDLIAAAIAEAVRAQPGAPEADAGEADFKLMLQGLLYGDSPAQGLVREGAFVHPMLRFAFDLPEGFTVQFDAATLTARAPGGAVMILDTTERVGSRLESYVRDDWAPALTRQVSSGYIYDLQSLEIGGFEAASAFQPYADEDGAKVAQLFVIRTDQRVYRFRGIAPAEDISASLAMEDAVRSFRRLPATEAVRYPPYWVQIHQVRRGETMNLFAAAVPLRQGAESRFRDLNGYYGDRVPVIGDLVKLVME